MCESEVSSLECIYVINTTYFVGDMLAQRGCRGTAVLVLTVRVRLHWVVNTMPPAALSPVKNPDTYCIGGWAGSRVLEGLEKRKFAAPLRFEQRTIHSIAIR
jgi:hypothetical protein